MWNQHNNVVSKHEDIKVDGREKIYMIDSFLDASVPKTNTQQWSDARNNNMKKRPNRLDKIIFTK